MPSAAHQFILRLIVQRMQEYGARVFFVDGRKSARYGDQVQAPPRVLHHKPDILGVTESGQICIGDAKTLSDIASKRTKQQLLDYTSVDLNGQLCEVFICVPSAGRSRLEKVLSDLGLTQHPHLHTLYVPTEVINRA